MRSVTSETDYIMHATDALLTFTEWLERVYPLPRPTATLEEWERATHRDLGNLDRDALHRELLRVRFRLAVERRPDPWLADREKAVLQAIRRRAPSNRASNPSGPRETPGKPPAARTRVALPRVVQR